MRHRTTLSTLLVLAVSLAATQALDAAPPARAQVRNLATIPLDEAFTPGREVLVDLVEIPAGTTLERHWHPGEEFHYYLEGEVEIRVEGQPAIRGVPGTVGHVPFRRKHVALGGAKGGKVLVFRVHTTGQPWRFAAPESAAAR